MNTELQNLAEKHANLIHEEFDGNEDLHFIKGFYLGHHYGSQEQGYSEQYKGWIALFKDEKNYLDFLKWQRQGYSEAEVKVHNKTQSGYSYMDYEEEEHLLKDRIIAYLSGREKGDGIEWAMVYEMMDAYHNVKIQHKGYTAALSGIDLDQVVYVEFPEKQRRDTPMEEIAAQGYQWSDGKWLKKTTIRELIHQPYK
jgi:hypothetical protein